MDRMSYFPQYYVLLIFQLENVIHPRNHRLPLPLTERKETCHRSEQVLEVLYVAFSDSLD